MQQIIIIKNRCAIQIRKINIEIYSDLNCGRQNCRTTFLCGIAN